MAPEPDSDYLTDASGFRGSAERVFTPSSETEVADVLRAASATKTSVTIAGAGTGLTGGRVAQGGWVLSLEKLKRLEVHDGCAVCGAGVLLRDLQSAAGAAKQFYPPDPTENGASIGGTIATNASGSRSFRYGATRRWIRALHVVLMSGEVLILHRGAKPPFEFPITPEPRSTKNTAGYFLRPEIDYLDLFVGSEGTLGVVTEAELSLLPAPQSLFTGVVFLASEERALDAVDAWRPVAGLRMLEFLDAASLGLLRVKFPDIPKSARVALLIEQENSLTEDAETAWLERLETAGAMTEASWFAASANDRDRFRRFRHALPEAVNDRVRAAGLKMGSDFAVPIAHNREMLRMYRAALDREFPGQYVIFGHIGDAHLHVNILPRDQAEWQRGKSLMTEFARQSVAFGGTVSAEHGLGKRKRELLPIQYSEGDIEKMKSVKRRLDPDCLLGRGTLFEV
jgi:FAD/FMN-containing dehydrogenase